MDKYPYSEKMVEDLDAILGVLKNRQGDHYHIDYMSQKPPFDADKHYAVSRVESAIRILSERDLVFLDTHGSPMIMRTGVEFFEDGGFSTERKRALENQEKVVAENETRRELREKQLLELSSRLENAEETIKKQEELLNNQRDFFLTSSRRNRIQIVFFYVSFVSLLISIISAFAVWSKWIV